jgi:HSP20 family protein
MAHESTMTKPAAENVRAAEHTRSGVYYRPHVDIVESKDELTLLADVPGADRESIDIDFEDGTLTLLAQVRPRQTEDVEYLVREYGVGDYYRTFQISEAIDASKISAEYADGVLVLHLPKTEAVKPRKISIKAS